MSRVKRIVQRDIVSITYDRMVEICAAIAADAHPDPRVEYSALLCAAATVMAVSRGIEPTNANCSSILRVITHQVVPAIEAEIEARA